MNLINPITMEDRNEELYCLLKAIKYLAPLSENISNRLGSRLKTCPETMHCLVQSFQIGSGRYDNWCLIRPDHYFNYNVYLLNVLHIG